MLGELLVSERRADRQRGREGGAGLANLFAGGQVGFEGLVEALVDGGDALFELVELGVAVDFPPFAAEHAVGGGGGLPTSSIGWRGWGDGDVGGSGFFVDG